MFIHALLHLAGLDDGSGAWYLFWSGFVGAVEGLTFFGFLAGAIHHANCHAHGCWRVGMHPVAGTPFKTCKVHHPRGGNSAEHIADMHDAAVQS